MIADKPRLFFLSESCFDRASKTRWVTHKGSNLAQGRVVPLGAAHPKSAYVQHSMHFERAKQGMPSAGQYVGSQNLIRIGSKQL